MRALPALSVRSVLLTVALLAVAGQLLDLTLQLLRLTLQHLLLPALFEALRAVVALLREILDGPRMAEMQAAFDRRDFTNLPRCAECFKHGGESQAFNDVLTGVQNLPGAAKDVVRKVIDVRYRN